MARALKYLIELAAVGAAYFILARSWLDLVSVHPGAAAFWPPAGFALAAVLLGEYRVVPAIFAAAYAAKSTTWDPDDATAALAAGQAFAAFAGGVLVAWWAGGRNVFALPTCIAKFVLIAAIAAAIGAGVSVGVDLGVGVSTPIEQVDWAKFTALWSPRWLGEFAALMMITPVLVLWATDYPRAFDLPALLELTAIFAVAGGLGVLAFGPLVASPSAAPLAVVAVLPPLWAALRRGPRDSATAAIILLGFAAWQAVFFRGGPLVWSANEGAATLVVIGAWRPAACVLERASRRARFCVDAHLSRCERQTGRDDPAPGTHPQGHRGAYRHQACDQAPAPPLAENPHRVARRQPLRPGRGDGMGRRPRCGLHFRPRRQCRARCPGGGDRDQSALPSCAQQQAEAAHLCEFHVPGRQLETVAQGGGAA